MSNARVIPIALQAHMDTRATTLTALMKIEPRDDSYPTIGITRLDRDVVYDDGGGPVTYSAITGMVARNMQSSNGMDVGNSQSQHLLTALVDINEEWIRAGVYDYAWYTVYILNYEDLSQGHTIPPAGFGQIGQMTVDSRGLSFQVEMTDLTMLLKQPIVTKDSITCRAIYGSRPFGTNDGSPEEEFPCGATVTWSGTQTVTSVGLENTLAFTASGLGAPANAYFPGMFEWLTGNNAGRLRGVESQDASGNITSYEESMFPIKVGDTFRIRHDCTKWTDGAHGCKANFASVSADEWKGHYRGENLIPISDADAANTPGATVGTGNA